MSRSRSSRVPKPPSSNASVRPAAGSPPKLIRADFTLVPDSARVVIKPYLEEQSECRDRIQRMILAYDDATVEALLGGLLLEFEDRHTDFAGVLHERCRQIAGVVQLPDGLSESRRLLIGAHYLSEYALESAALFNPSIVPHPNQTGVAEGSLRIVMSLRSIGEGHISSIEFRTGMIDGAGNTSIDPPSGVVSAAMKTTNPVYRRRFFREIMQTVEAIHPLSRDIIDDLGEKFTREELDNVMESLLASNSEEPSRVLREIVEEIRFLAECNYSVRFPGALPMSERILMPQSPSEKNGIEDARFVKFEDPDGDGPRYFATYTAYNGRVTLPQLIETRDFTEFHTTTMSGKVAVNKGMAIFPRKIKGQYAALTRSDGCNNYIAFSDDINHWDEATLLAAPKFPWEILKVGNCGSPIETDRGWVVITHGVGAMRKYSVGVMLLDLEDPKKVLARLPEPLITPVGNEREGYVPNVVYTCGALAHEGWLVLPYAMGDYATTVGKIRMEELVDALLACAS